MPVEKWKQSTTLETIVDTATSAALANNATLLSAAITPADQNFIFAIFELTVTFTVAPVANAGLSIWGIKTVDGGTTYEDFPSPRPADIGLIPVLNVTTAQRVSRILMIPPGTFRIGLRNDATGQTMPAGWGLKMRPVTREGV